ncbi:hypothetical protein [Methanosarcina siciliae]|nr:hypothetical protein [Methanosarcina siciliae]
MLSKAGESSPGKVVREKSSDKEGLFICLLENCFFSWKLADEHGQD